jgi:gliding motility-associated-like protein
MKYFLPLICFLFISLTLRAQTCTTLGQTPSTAFPVCGTTTFQQTNVPICTSHTLQVPGCAGDGASYADKNPFWYKFTCFQAGTLGFLVTPNNQGDDYDWMLYDITGHNPDDVFTDISLIVTGNWAGTYGNTGASASGLSFIQCASDPAANKNSFAHMPNLIVGHTYLLLISHYTDSQSGYGLSFGGGTAVITDPTVPGLKTAEASCGGNIIRIKLKKKIKCSSLTSTGSEFFVTPGNVPIASAVGIGCSTGFDTDSIELNLGAFLAPGTYTLNIKLGTDNNTLLDYCDNAIPVTDKVDFTVYPLVPTPMDSLAPVVCKPQSLRLIFRKPILCSSVEPGGSDFIITGTYPVSIASAAGSCTNGSTTSKEIIINLSQPLYTAGSFTLTLRTGTDGNTILDECGKETPAGATLTFSVKDTVNADFTYQKFYGCTFDTVNFFHPGGNGVNNWQWTLDENQTSAQQNPQALYRNFNQKNIRLVVGNGFCTDTASQVVALTNFLKADFSVYEDNCPNEPVKFTSLAQGQLITGHSWTFGDGGTATDASPTHIYLQPYNTTAYIVRYTVTDSIGCQNTAQKTVKVYSSCFIAVPNAFTPNNDGKNDLLHPLNAIKAEQLDFRVFNRWGQLVFQTNDWKRGWDGTMQGHLQGTGVYAWYLTFVDRDTKERRQMKGTSILIR